MVDNNFDLHDCLAELTSDPKAESKILQYIDQQHGPKSKVVMHIEMGELINVILSTEEGDNILACVLTYSEHYHNKIIELTAS